MKELQYRKFSVRTHARRGFMQQPSNCQFELTFGCRLHCRHCYSDCYNKAEFLKKELDIRRDELSNELKGRVSELVFMAAERVLLKTVDQKANKELIGQFLKDLEGKDSRYKLGN